MRLRDGRREGREGQVGYHATSSRKRPFFTRFRPGAINSAGLGRKRLTPQNFARGQMSPFVSRDRESATGRINGCKPLRLKVEARFCGVSGLTTWTKYLHILARSIFSPYSGGGSGAMGRLQFFYYAFGKELLGRPCEQKIFLKIKKLNSRMPKKSRIIGIGRRDHEE